MTGDLFYTPDEERRTALIQTVKDEIGYRRSVYPRLIRERRMTQERADERIAGMIAVQTALEKLTRAEAVVVAAAAVLKENFEMIDPGLAVDLRRALTEFYR